MNKKSKNDKGFTLIELLIVIAIIGILAAIAIPQFNAYKQRAYDTDAKSNLHGLFMACKAYWADTGSNSSCSIATLNATAYGFNQSAKVSIVDSSTTELAFSASAGHSDSTASWYMTTNGSIGSY